MKELVDSNIIIEHSNIIIENERWLKRYTTWLAGTNLNSMD